MTKKSEEANDRTASARLSRAVKHVRETKQLTLVAVAAATGISRNTLFLIETKAANVRLSTIDTLASLMGVNPSQLLEKSPHLSGRLLARASLSQTVAHNIAAFRTSINMSQETLGEAAGLAKGYLSLIEISAPDLKVDTVDAIVDREHCRSNFASRHPREMIGRNLPSGWARPETVPLASVLFFMSGACSSAWLSFELIRWARSGPMLFIEFKPIHAFEAAL